MRLNKSRLSLMGLLVISLLAAPLAVWAQTASTYFITNVDASAFPDVQFQFRALDLQNQAVANLTSSTVTVFENGQPVSEAQVTQSSMGGVNIIFVIDQGQRSGYNNFGLPNMRQAITTLVTGGYFQDGVDTVTVLGRQNLNSDQTVTLLERTSSGTALTTWAANFNFANSSKATKGLLGVEDAVVKMAEAVPTSGTQTVAIIFITRFLEDPARNIAESAAQNTAQLARQSFIPVHVFQTDQGPTQPQPLQLLANGSNGTYTQLKRNTVEANVAPVYQAITAQRSIYTVTYRSTSSESGQRSITLNAPQATAGSLPGGYSVNIAPPSLTLEAPSSGTTYTRLPRPSAENASIYLYDQQVVEVKAQISFPPDTAVREIVSVEFLVDDALEESRDSIADISDISFRWDISSFTQPGTYEKKLTVKAVDELGLEASAETSVTIVVQAPPTPTPPSPVETAVEDYGLLIGGVVCVGIVGVLFVGGLLFFLLRPKKPSVLASSGMPMEAAATIIVSGPRQGKALAVLTVLEGPKALVNEKISLTKPVTLLGRDPSRADVVFYSNEPSSVSRLHCTLQKDGDIFVLTDNGSTSGSKINGQWLKPNDPVQLRDGDEIVMGDLGKMGVKLRFNLQSSVAAEESIDRTFIVDRSDKDWDRYKE